jgi:hypothetical protein
MDLPRIALLGAAALFVGYLLTKLRPLWSRRRRASLAEVNALRKRASEARDPGARAEALLSAGEAAARAGRWTSAAGLLLRALRALPDSPAAVERTIAALRPRPRLLRALLERRLGSLGTQTHDERAAYVATARHLVALYRRSVRKRFMATILERLISHEQRIIDQGGPQPG